MTDPLSLGSIPSVKGVATGIPLVPKGQYDLQCTNIGIEESKNTPGARNLVVELQTTTPIESIPDDTGKTRTLNPGFPFKKYCPLQAKEGGKDPEWYLRNLAELIDAFMGTTADNRPELAECVSQFSGRTVRATITVEDSTQGGKQNSIQRLSKVPTA